MYYYDHAGNLLKTVPPEGVHPEYGGTFLNNVRTARSTNGSAVVPSHSLATNYRYNTLNQVIAQVSPDGGQSDFWYDVLGRLVVSRNAKQKNADHYSYTVYDQLGRISEVGEMTNTTAMSPAIARNPQDLDNWMHNKAVRDVTVTSYDIAYGESPSDPEGIMAGTVLTQRNLRNRVSWSAIYNSGTFGGLGLGDHASATFYTYDIHGNVDTLVQDYLGLFGETDFSRFKKIEYDYDLISGKVNKVSYQRGRPDQFYHRYAYDAENRLTGVQTSHDGWVWENEANYDYYKHGPLARTVIGQQQVQGVDYAYTVQGWLKGVNGTQVGDGTYDMGQDGKTGSVHDKVARDAYGFSLNYYTGSPWSDYHAIGATGNKFASVLSALSTNAKSLYNGNIAAMAVNIRGIGDAKLYNYKYDQLNRIVEMDAYSGLQSNNTWTPVASDDYKERVTYDANGNILTYLRNGATSVNGLAMDTLTYQYGRNNAGQLLNNRLRYVHDRVADNAYTEDIDSQTPLTLAQVQAEKLDAQTTDNYAYDEIGNLIKDTKEGITAIDWNVYGKIKSITKGAMTITYTYDASGNRISKVVTPASGPIRKTYYVRDATGNVMSVYEEGGLVNDGNLTQSEVHLYGSNRLGIFKPDVDMTSLAEAPGGLFGYERGKKFFELSNHLGNVLVTVTDRKNGVELSSNTALVNYYLPDVASANDYYPFGMTMPGRSVHSDKYRYGFNGQEKSTELDPNGNSMTAEFWQYDARLGRRWNVDPIYQNSSYSGLGNSPIALIDPNGADTIRFNRTLIRNRFAGRWDGHSDNLTTKGKESVSTTFSITSSPATGKDVFLFTQTTIDDGLTSSVTTQLHPDDANSAAGITKGKNLYFDGLWTTERKNSDWETIGKFMNGYKGFNDYMVARNPNSANWRAKAMSISAMEGIMPLAVQISMGSWLGFRYLGASGAAKGVAADGANDYVKLIKEAYEFNPSTTLYRGTTGSEAASTQIYLTNDAAVAATYVKNGGSVMQYQVSQFAIKKLRSTGELTIKTGIHQGSSVVSTEYMFSGKKLVEAINSIAKPL